MSPQTSNDQLTGFASYIVECGLLNKDQVKAALDDSSQKNTPFVIYLIQQKLVDSEQIANLIAKHFGLSVFDLHTYDPKTLPKDLINKQLANNQLISKKYALPLFQNNDSLYIAVVDPTIPGLDEMSFLTGLNVKYVVVDFPNLVTLINNLKKTHLSMVLSDFEEPDLKLKKNISHKKSEHLDIANIGDGTAPIVRFINDILIDAINQGASDIHFEPFSNSYRIRFRLDGLLYEITSPPAELINYFVARLKVMANLDISEHRIPQDGRFRCTLSGNRTIDFRVSTCPVLHGEKIVLRILSQIDNKLNVDDLGFEDFQKEKFLNAINKPQGIILVTGPTGSGKTITLYTALGILNKLDTNISTVEDPIEIEMPGVNQVPVNLATNLTFSAALRAFLRQDPDIIMVGEIRDLETAQIAVKASQTGHLVLSTLHTNSSAATISRLANMGLEAFNLASSVSLIMAQRLVRKLCTHCKQEIKIPGKTLLQEGFKESEIGKFQLYGPNTTSCKHCMNGYIGRTGIFEVMAISEEIKNLMLLEKSVFDLDAQSRKEGMICLREAGLLKVKRGITSLEEINRVTSQ